MTQRQVLRQLAEAGQLRLQDFDPAGLVGLLREELITVAGQTVTLTDKGRRLAAPKKPPVPPGKPPHPLPPARRNYPMGRREQPSKRGYYTAKERSHRSIRAWTERNPPLIDWSKPDPDRDERLRKLAQLLSAPLRHNDGTEWTADDHFRGRLRTHLEEPEGWLLPEEQAAANEPIWHGHGYKLDDDTFEFPLDMTSRQYFNLHAQLHAERAWPHHHRRLHVDEEAWLAKDLRIPLAQLRAANAKGGMFDLTRLPIDERDRRDKLLGLARQGLRYVYTLNSKNRLRTLHQVPTEDDLLALPAHAASVLWCSELWYYLEQNLTPLRPPRWRPTTRQSNRSSTNPSNENASIPATSSTSNAATVPPGTTRSLTRQKPTTAPSIAASVGTAPTIISSGTFSVGSYGRTTPAVLSASASPSHSVIAKASMLTLGRRRWTTSSP